MVEYLLLAIVGLGALSALACLILALWIAVVLVCERIEEARQDKALSEDLEVAWLDHIWHMPAGH
jgi:hypothetical protein